MTIKECIDLVDNLKPNSYSIEDKVNWLSFIDMTIINDVLKTHEGYDARYDDFTGYSPDVLNASLIVPSPYDRLYTSYLAMKIDEHNGETARYNNSAMMFNSYMAEFRKWYNKLHRPIPFGRKATPTPSKNLDVTDAQMEALRRLLYAELQEDMFKKLSDDKILTTVKAYMSTNTHIFDDMIYNTVSRYLNEINTQISIGEVELLASRWNGSGSLHSQIVDIKGVTTNSQVDLTPSAEQLAIFYDKDITFVTENENGVVTVYAIGQKPQNDYRIQVTITEVQYG